MKYILLLALLLFSGCVCLDPSHKKAAPPVANTDRVIESLERTKTDLNKIGESNTAIGNKVDKALNLSEKLAFLLDQIEEEKKDVLPEDPFKILGVTVKTPEIPLFVKPKQEGLKK